MKIIEVELFTAGRPRHHKLHARSPWTRVCWSP